MSKHFKDVYAHKFQMSFLETIQPEPCNAKNTMDIIVEEVNDDGSPWAKQAIRFVKVCHSKNECIHYEIVIDPNTGIGTITLDDIQASNAVVVQVDECGNQMVNGDSFDISYMVNEAPMEEDYASVSFQKEQHACVRIVNRVMKMASVSIHKTMRNQEGKSYAPCDDDEFMVRITKGDCFERFVKLNKTNQFHAVLEDVTSGTYMMEEYEYCDFQPFYRLNDGEETSSPLVTLREGANTLEIMNEERVDTQLTIQKFMVDGSNTICKPDGCDVFEVAIISDEHEECITLCEENDFCVTLYGLTPSSYDVSEVGCAATLYETSYIVDDGEECSHALVEVCVGARRNVKILNCNVREDNQNIRQESALRICKSIRYCDGYVGKPHEDEQFKILICGCGMNEAFHLNANNNFCIDVASLCIGHYEIKEVGCGDYNTSYSINGQREKTSACIHYDGSENFCISIINEERNRGSIRIAKYIHNECGDLTKPNKGQCFSITLSSYFCKHCFVLNEENDFCMSFHDLRFGSYEVREEGVCDYETSYQINCEREKRNARLTIDNSYENEVKIINRVFKNTCGILHISKLLESNCKELVKPTRDETFEIEIEGPCFCERYILKASNQWDIQLEGLKEGEYQIRECHGGAYDVSYLVNKEHCSEAIVYMGECNQEVCIINHPIHSGNLVLSACIRRCDGTMQRPNNAMSFDILVEGSDDCIRVCLRPENMWCVVLDDLCEGKYRIIQKDSMGFNVSYIVNGKEDSFGKVRLGCQDEEVTIVNEETPCMGNVIVTKYIVDEYGNEVMPCSQDEYHFELRGRCNTNCYTLHKRNDFCIYFDDLDEGEYELYELDEGYDVAYRINGVCVEHACFVLRQEDVHIDIINTIRQVGHITIEKRIRKGNALALPCQGEQYQILLKGKNCHEIYELNDENMFCVTLCDLVKQHYEVKELNCDSNVSFDINGCIQTDGYFLYDGEDLQVTVINEELLYGCMELRKVIAGEDGQWYRPNRYECFEILVESDCFKQKIILNHENDFCVKLYDLPQAHYEVKELNKDCYVRYFINNLPYESACVDVCEEDVCITIINHPYKKGNLHFQAMIEEDGCLKRPSCDDLFCVCVSVEEGLDEIVLDETNEFCACLCDVRPGTYQLQVRNEENIRFEMEDQCFQNNVCIELDGEDVYVNVIRESIQGFDITIRKYMQDTHGVHYQPKDQASYEVILTGPMGSRCMTLSKENHFTQVLHDMPCGSYEIKEQGCDDVRYQIEDQRLQVQGCFEVTSKDVQVRLFNLEKACAYLHVESCLKDCDGRMIHPCDDMSFHVEVVGDCEQKRVCLNANNHWHTKLLLQEGTYRVTQEDDPCFMDVCYLVNDEEVEHACVELCGEDQYVTTLNVEHCANGSIELCKLIRDDEGCYRYPDPQDTFELRVVSNQMNKTIELNASNHFYASVRGLVDGWYEIIEESGSNDVVYVVNNAQPTNKGMVCVCGNANTVNIINPSEEHTKKGLMELNKYVRKSDQLVRASSGSYRIHVSKPGFNEIFTLTKENEYHLVVRDLDEGLYVVDEMDHEQVTYIVNGGSEVDRASVMVHGDANRVDIINTNQTPVQGSITLAKYIRKNGQLLRPSGCDSYVFLVSRPGFHQLYTLDASNQWMQTIEGLADGDYVVNETTSTNKVSYIINGSSEVDRAIVSVQGNRNSVQIINEQYVNKGCIHIEKYIREAMKLRRPSGLFKIDLYVSKPGYNQAFTLDASNDWMVDITNLENGLYVIDEVRTNDEVSYIINGGSEVTNGIVTVENNENMVMMIDTINDQSSSITLSKFIRVGDGTLLLPSGNDSFQIEVKGGVNYLKQVTLDRGNNWTTTLSQLDNGYYEIRELSNQGYAISYIVDDGLESQNASLRLFDNAHSVKIINSSQAMLGRLELRKIIKKADGSEMMPVDGDVFFVEISNEDTIRKIQLDSGNAFTSVIQDLNAGKYNVRELYGLKYITSYRVNGGPEEAKAIVTMASGVNNTVEILNELSGNRSVIEVFKYMLDRDGNYLPPSATDVYYFTIKGLNNDVFQTLELNVGNNWNQSLRTLPSGTYQIKESGSSPYPVKYIVNSADLKEEAIFESTPGKTSIIGIINQLGTSNQGTIILSKRIRDITGTLSMPSSGEIFTVNVGGNGRNEIITLDPENNYTFTLSDVVFGMYNVEEVGNNYSVTYRVNEGNETSRGIVNVDSVASNVVLVINTPNDTTNVGKQNDQVVRVVIE